MRMLSIFSRTDTSLLSKCAGPRLLTPHPGEMDRIFETKNLLRFEIARRFTDLFPVVLLLKGSRTIIAGARRPALVQYHRFPGHGHRRHGRSAHGRLRGVDRAGSVVPRCSKAWRLDLRACRRNSDLPGRAIRGVTGGHGPAWKHGACFQTIAGRMFLTLNAFRLFIQQQFLDDFGCAQGCRF